MLLHEGVLRWQENWREFPLPNAFLGIDRAVAEYYESLTAPEKCTLRWLSHRREMAKLRRVLGTRLIIMNYEELIIDTQTQLKRLQHFQGLHDEFPPITVKKDSLDRWRRDLPALAVGEINETLGRHVVGEEASLLDTECRDYAGKEPSSAGPRCRSSIPD